MILNMPGTLDVRNIIIDNMFKFLPSKWKQNKMGKWENLGGVP